MNYSQFTLMTMNLSTALFVPVKGVLAVVFVVSYLEKRLLRLR